MTCFITVFPITNYFHYLIYIKIELMNNYFTEIEKIKERIKVERLEIIDNSFKHKNHKPLPDKLHIHLKIKSYYLNSTQELMHKK